MASPAVYTNFLIANILDPRLLIGYYFPSFTYYYSLQTCFQSFGLVPDVTPVAPYCYLNVKYPSGVEAKLGNELTPTQVKDQPQLSWSALPNQLYTLVLADPDVPSRRNPEQGAFLHWLVGNIPGNDITSGDILADYVGSATPEGTGLHRYVFLIYQQPYKLQFDEPRLNNTSDFGRYKFSFAKFVEKHQLGCPVAGNFYQAQYDDYVPVLTKQLIH